MAGTVFDSKLNAPRTTSRAQFGLATRGDDADIRSLLRGNPMPGMVTLSMEREPDSFADAALPGVEKQTIVARESGRVACTGSCTVRTRFVNGEKRHVGYLGGLRLDASVAGRFDILRRGYQCFRELQEASPADCYFTSIASDNLRARHFLERGVTGMPAYEWIGDFVTLLIPVPRHGASASLFSRGENTPTFTREACAFVNEQSSQGQLAPCWSAEEMMALRPLGLGLENFRFTRRGPDMTACAALWDQRCFKQTVIRGYAPSLALARPFINLASNFTRIPHLPAPGGILSHAFVSHFAATTDRLENFLPCIDAMLAAARESKIAFVTMGFDARDPRLTRVNAKFRSRKYHSRIYSVRWSGIGVAAGDLDGRLLCPEVALL